MKRGAIKISTFMISILLVAFFVVTFSNLFAEVSTKYGVNYDTETNDSIQVFNQFQEIQNTTKQINQTLFETETGSVTDLLGGFLGAGFNVLKLTGASVSAFFSMVTGAAEILPGVDSSMTAILLTIVVLLVIFAIIAVLVGRDI